MRRLAAALIATALAALLAAAPAVADPRPTLTVALHQRPPWRQLVDTRPAGADVDILAALADELGFDLEYKVDTLTRCLRMMRRGEADIITGLTVTPKREKYMDFVTPPYATNRTVAFYADPRRAAGITRYEHLRGFVVAKVRGKSYFPQFDVDDELRKSSRASLAANFERLASGQSYLVVIADEPHADWWLSHYPDTARHVAKAPLLSHQYHPLHIALSRKGAAAPGLGRDIGLALARMIQSGAAAAILSRNGIRP